MVFDLLFMVILDFFDFCSIKLLVFLPEVLLLLQLSGNLQDSCIFLLNLELKYLDLPLQRLLLLFPIFLLFLQSIVFILSHLQLLLELHCFENRIIRLCSIQQAVIFNIVLTLLVLKHSGCLFKFYLYLSELTRKLLALFPSHPHLILLGLQQHGFLD